MRRPYAIPFISALVGGAVVALVIAIAGGLSGNQKTVTTVQQVAHTLKSSSAQVGAMALSAYCQRLEALGRARTLNEEAAVIMAHIDEHYPRIEAALNGTLQPPQP